MGSKRSSVQLLPSSLTLAARRQSRRSLVSNVLAHREQFHQSRLVEHVIRQALQQVTNYFAAQGSSLAQASQQAIAWIGQQVQTQASFLAYMDAFWVLMLISLSTKFWVAVGKAWSRKLFGAKLNAVPGKMAGAWPAQRSARALPTEPILP